METKYGFEDFLNEYYLENEDEGRSHNSSSAQENYERWSENLGFDELVDLADRFAEKVRKGLDKPTF